MLSSPAPATVHITNQLRVEFVCVFQLQDSFDQKHCSREVFIPHDALTISLNELFPWIWVRRGNTVLALDVEKERQLSGPLVVK
jgi:hypothetical protein